MKRIHGRDCNLYIEKNGERTFIPYKEETVRECLEGYSLDACIGDLEKETYISLNSSIKGCCLARISKKFAIFLFENLSNPNSQFSFLADRVIEKKQYTKLTTKTFNITANNKNPFYVNLEIQSTKNSKVENWENNEKTTFTDRTYIYDGTSVIANEKTFPLIYRFDINGDYTELKKLTLDLYMPMTNSNFESFRTIEKLKILVDRNDGIKIEARNLVPINDMCDITASDTNLIRRKYKILGDLKLIIKNENEYKEIKV